MTLLLTNIPCFGFIFKVTGILILLFGFFYMSDFLILDSKVTLSRTNEMWLIQQLGFDSSLRRCVLADFCSIPLEVGVDLDGRDFSFYISSNNLLFSQKFLSFVDSYRIVIMPIDRFLFVTNDNQLPALFDQLYNRFRSKNFYSFSLIDGQFNLSSYQQEVISQSPVSLNDEKIYLEFLDQKIIGYLTVHKAVKVEELESFLNTFLPSRSLLKILSDMNFLHFHAFLKSRKYLRLVRYKEIYKVLYSPSLPQSVDLFRSEITEKYDWSSLDLRDRFSALDDYCRRVYRVELPFLLGALRIENVQEFFSF